jgi:hypothetical protein
MAAGFSDALDNATYPRDFEGRLRFTGGRDDPIEALFSRELVGREVANDEDRLYFFLAVSNVSI